MGNFIDKHTNWFILLICVGVSGFMVVAIILGSHSGPGLVYDPQVVDRQVVDPHGNVVADCAVSHSGMTCWKHAP